MNELGFQRAQVLWSCPSEVGQGKKTAGGGRKKLDMKDITGLPSAAILHNAKLHKRFFIAPKWEIYSL